MSVGVVIPCFNSGEFVRETLASVDAQTRRADQVIVVNDGSDEPESRAILNELVASGVSVVTQTNRGVAAARNRGLEECTTDWVMVIDAGDLLAANAIELLCDYAESHPDVSLIAGDVEDFGDSTTYHRATYTGPESMLAESAIPVTAMFRRDLAEEVGGYPSLRVGSHWALWMRMLVAGVEVGIVDGLIYRHRTDELDRMIEKHPISLAKTKNLILSEAWTIYREFPEFVIEDYSQQRLMSALYRRRYGRLESLRSRLTEGAAPPVPRRKRHTTWR